MCGMLSMVRHMQVAYASRAFASGNAGMVRYTDDEGRLLCHRCMDRGCAEIAIAQVPARKPGYVYYMCLYHLRVWYWRRRRASRRENDRRHMVKRRQARHAGTGLD